MFLRPFLWFFQSALAVVGEPCLRLHLAPLWRGTFRERLHLKVAELSCKAESRAHKNRNP